MTDRFKTVLLFGAPGAGKGTQGKILGAIPGFYHLSCVDVFRTIDINSDIGKVFFYYSAHGEIVPDDEAIGFWRPSMQAYKTLSHYKSLSHLIVL